MHDGKPPRGGIEACRRELGRIGEGRVFRAASNSLSKLSGARNSVWPTNKVLRQLIMTVTRDNRRLPCYNMVKYLKDMQVQIMRVEAAANDLRKALDGLMEPIWVERYIAERVEPLREEFALLETRVRQLSPVVYTALFHGG